MSRSSLVLLLCAVANPIAAQTPALGPDSLRALAVRVSTLEMLRQGPAATPATIDSLLALYADSVVYEHPNAGAIVRGKATMRHNMREYLGSVRAVRASPDRITIGHGVVIIESNAEMEIHDGDHWSPVKRHGLRVVEFNGQGLVRRIIDYPW